MYAKKTKNQQEMHFHTLAHEGKLKTHSTGLPGNKNGRFPEERESVLQALACIIRSEIRENKAAQGEGGRGDRCRLTEGGKHLQVAV